jgi:hypothetical protein
MSNSNDNSGLAGVAGLAFAGAIILFALFAAASAFIAAIMSIVCLMAWERPIELFGHTLTPQEARGFIKRGLAGALIAPGFVIFASGFLQVPIRSDAWPYIVVGGYVIGSLVIGYFIGKAELEAAQQAQEAASLQALSPPVQSDRPVHTIDARASITPVSEEQVQPQPFRFATWDDEEELRK